MSEALIEHLRDLFEPFGPLSARAMFGGHGLYLDGMIVGIILDGTLYLKTDADTRPYFEAAGCTPAVYAKGDTVLPMSYWSVPEEALDSPAAMRPWVERALRAARNKPARKPRRK